MKDPYLFVIPVLGRYGLTHGLLAWARARLWCEEHRAVMLAPFWFKVRTGPYIRRERDKRNYFLLFNRGTAVGGLQRLVIMVRTRKMDVGVDWPAKPGVSSRPVLLRFHNALKDNEKKSFAQIVGHGALLRRELLAMTRRRYHPVSSSQPFISIHVRLGDFSMLPTEGDASACTTNTRLPIDWYISRLDALRDALGKTVPAVVFSDGSDEELDGLLSRTAVTRAPKQQSVTDLLHMGLGVALIASGSGFSLWGSFLGSTPRIAHPGQSIVSIDKDSTRDIESGLAEPIPATFVAHVLQRLGR